MMKITPNRFAAEVRRVAGLYGTEPISGKHLIDVRLGRRAVTTGKVVTIVAAARRLARLAVKATDLFELEPAAHGLTDDVLIGHPDPARGQTRHLSIFWVPRALGRASVNDDLTHLTAVQALEILYRDHAPLMLTTARLRYSIPAEDAEALVHDVFVSFFERQPNVQDPRAYLLGAINHACRHYKRKRRNEEPLIAEVHDTFDPADAERHERWMMMLSVGAALAQLGDRCRDTLCRYYLGKERPETIAQRLDVSPGYVHQILHGCRKRAREMFAERKG
jgi:RNA polymerase sigma factor (sigma-70 family)